MLEMKSAEEIRIEVFIALHELPRDQLGLQQIDLGGTQQLRMEYPPTISGTSSTSRPGTGKQ